MDELEFVQRTLLKTMVRVNKKQKDKTLINHLLKTIADN
jgi:hypothetical protein